MSETVNRQNTILNQIWKRVNKQYHLYSTKHNLSDPAMWTLYTLNESDDALTQNDIASEWMYSKQTVNFTIAGLVKKGYVYLEPMSGARNSKAIRLTEAGKALCRAVICPLVEAEERTLLCMTEEERRQFIALNEKYCNAFQATIQELPLK